MKSVLRVAVILAVSALMLASAYWVLGVTGALPPFASTPKAMAAEPTDMPAQCAELMKSMGVPMPEMMQGMMGPMSGGMMGR